MWKNRKKITLFILVLMVGILISCKKEKEKKILIQKEYYLVLDTSGSMAFGPFLQIQKRLDEFFSIFNNGDKIYVISFDKEPRTILTVENYNESKKEDIKEVIRNLKPVGLYTDFQSMIDYVKELVNSNSKEQIDEKEDSILITKKQQYIIILTDGKDEPYLKRKKINLREYEAKEKLPITDRYIYYVSFSDTKSQELETNLQNISDNVKTIERPISQGGSDTSKSNNLKEKVTIKDPTGIEEIKRDIELKQENKEKENIIFNILENLKINYLYFLVSIVFILILLLYLIYKKYKPSTMVGELIFYESGSHPSMGKTIKLSRFEKNVVSIGNDPSCLIRIRSSDFPKKIEFKGLEKKGNFYFKIPKRFSKDIQFLNTKSNNLIEAGDKFKIKNYIFEYNYGNKAKK